MRNRYATAAAFSAMALALAGCSANAARIGHEATGGDPQRGAAAISRYGCGTCHSIAKIHSAHGLVGPPLTGIADRMYVAGILRNTPENVTRWIEDPKALNPKTAMPKLGVTHQDATDIAAYLYSIP